jgi:conjugal transfer pilus assembly protein TraW
MFVLGIVLLVFIISGISYADGKVYPIAERDFLSEIEEKAKKVEPIVRKKIEEEERKFLESKGEILTKAKKSYSYYVDITYTLPEDIMYYDRGSNQWKVLYPKGYRFNPIDYVMVDPPPIVVFNACDKSEVDFVSNFVKGNPLGYIYVSSGCPIGKIDSNFQIFLLTKELKDKFKLKNTVSVISIDRPKKMVLVRVFAVNRK